MVFTSRSIEEFSDGFACLLSNWEADSKLILFFVWRHKFKAVLENMSNILNSGKSLSVDRFERIARNGSILNRYYLTSTVMTSGIYVIVALYIIIVKSVKVHIQNYVSSPYNQWYGFEI